MILYHTYTHTHAPREIEKGNFESYIVVVTYRETDQNHDFEARDTLDKEHKTHSSNEPSSRHTGSRAISIGASFWSDRSTSKSMRTPSHMLAMRIMLHSAHMLHHNLLRYLLIYNREEHELKLR